MPRALKRYASTLKAALSYSTLIGFGVVGCSANNSSPAANTLTTAQSEGELAFTDCMSDADFDMTELGSIPPHVDLESESVWAQRDFRQKFADCVEEAGIGEFELNEPGERAAHDAKMLEFTDCLRRAEWTVSPPTPNDHLFGALGFPDVEVSPSPQQQAKLADDAEACGIPQMQSGHIAHETESSLTLSPSRSSVHQ